MGGLCCVIRIAGKRERGKEWCIGLGVSGYRTRLARFHRRGIGRVRMR